MSDDAGAVLADLLDGQLDPGVFAFLAIIHRRDDPRDLRALRIVGRMVVDAVVGQLLHGVSQSRGRAAEGLLRKRWKVNGEDCDTALYGLLREEFEDEAQSPGAVP